MIEIGKMQTLVIDRETSIGVYLRETSAPSADKENSVLLPKKEVAHNVKPGDKIEAFIYRDSKDRLIATTRRPKIMLGEFAPLKVVDITRVGAFLDWGLEKDLLLPYHEQITRVQIGREYLVYLYVDKSNRLCATTKIYPRLKGSDTHNVGDWVEGYLYQINREMGAFVAVDNQYHGLIPAKELSADFHCGDQIRARVTQIRKDGKLILSPNRKAYREIPRDAKLIWNRLKENDGFLPYNDKTSPQIIAKEFKMSKAAFKRALGHLMKTQQIIQASDGIHERK